MEFDDYLRTSFRHVRLILALALLGFVVAYAVTRLAPTSYDASIAVTILRVNEPTTTDYQYDAYYTMQATDLVAQSVIAWFGTPSFVSEVYSKAGFDPAIRSIDEVARRFRSKKTSNQNILIEFSDESKEATQKLSSALVAAIQERVPALVTSVDGKPSFDVRADQPVIIEKNAKPVSSGLIGALAGALVGMFVATAIEGVRRRGA
jgi:uncharacterized protein involved in exopolysaccharide biosynthesis